MHDSIITLDIIASGSDLTAVDRPIRPLVACLNAIPSLATYATSCAGHADEEAGNTYLLNPSGHISFLCCPEVLHVRGLVQLLFDFSASHHGTGVRAKTPESFGKHLDYATTIAGMDELLDSRYVIGRTAEQYAIQNLIFVQDNCGWNHQESNGSALRISCSDACFEAGCRRYEEIQENWNELTRLVQGYCHEHNFSAIDYRKQEFDPLFS